MLGTLVQGSSWQEKLLYKGAPQHINLFSCLRGKLPLSPHPSFLSSVLVWVLDGRSNSPVNTIPHISPPHHPGVSIFAVRNAGGQH